MPVPRIVSASPVATWLACSEIVSTPKASAASEPASTPASTASPRPPPCATAANAATAPTSIIPSTPRLRTPERSVTSSPSAASISGIAAATALATSGLIESTVPLRERGAATVQPEVHQHLAAEEEHQEQPLEHERDRSRQLEGDLRRFAADIEQRHQEGRERDPERAQPSERGDDDRGEAIAGGPAVVELPERPGDLAHAREPGARAADHQDHPDRALLRVARIARGRRREAGDGELEAEEGPLDEHPGERDRHERDEERGVEARALEPLPPRGEQREQRVVGELDGDREVVAVRVSPRAEHQVLDEEVGHVGQHEAHQDLVRVQLRAQERGDRRPQHSADRAGEDHARQRPGAPLLLEVDRDAGREDAAEVHLPLGADVPDVGAEPDRESERDQAERRGLEEQLAHAVRVADRIHEIDAERAHRILTERGEDREADDQRQRRGEHRREPLHRTRRHGAADELEGQHGAQCGVASASAGNPPAIQRPISSALVADTSRTGERRPPAITTTRSQISRISPRSSETTSVATPCTARSMTRCRIKADAAISTPQVGCASTITFGRWPISRPTMNFCRLPPDRLCAGAAGPPQRTSYSLMHAAAKPVAAVASTNPWRTMPCP